MLVIKQCFWWTAMAASSSHIPGPAKSLATYPRPATLRVESHKLASRFVGPFLVSKINPVVVHVQLPRSLKVYPTFHVARIKPVKESPLARPEERSWVSASNIVDPDLMRGFHRPNPEQPETSDAIPSVGTVTSRIALVLSVCVLSCVVHFLFNIVYLPLLSFQTLHFLPLCVSCQLDYLLRPD